MWCEQSLHFDSFNHCVLFPQDCFSFAVAEDSIGSLIAVWKDVAPLSELVQGEREPSTLKPKFPTTPPPLLNDLFLYIHVQYVIIFWGGGPIDSEVW